MIIQVGACQGEKVRGERFSFGRLFLSCSLAKQLYTTFPFDSQQSCFLFQNLGCQTTLVNKDVVESSDVVFFAVKPHLIVQVVREIAPYVNPDRHLFVTVAAAIRTEVIEQVTKILFSQIQYFLFNCWSSSQNSRKAWYNKSKKSCSYFCVSN